MVLLQTAQESVRLKARKEQFRNVYWGVVFHRIRWLFKKGSVLNNWQCQMDTSN
jgi:hypothetical protein